MKFAHRKKAEKLQADIDHFLAKGGKITTVPDGFSGEKSAYGRMGTHEAAVQKSRLNGQKARGRQKKETVGA